MEKEQVMAAAPPNGRAAEDWITAREAGEALGIAERTLRKWAAKGRVCREFGPDGRPRYRTQDIRLLQAETRAEPGARLPAPGPKAAAATRRRPPATPARPARVHRAVPAPGGKPAGADAWEQQLRAENAWLRESLQRAQKSEEELRCLLLNAQRAERDFRSLLLQAHTTLQVLGRPPAAAVAAPGTQPPAHRSRAGLSSLGRRAKPHSPP
jgi:hypothetical protein